MKILAQKTKQHLKQHLKQHIKQHLQQPSNAIQWNKNMLLLDAVGAGGQQYIWNMNNRALLVSAKFILIWFPKTNASIKY